MRQTGARARDGISKIGKVGKNNSALTLSKMRCVDASGTLTGQWNGGYRGFV